MSRRPAVATLALAALLVPAIASALLQIDINAPGGRRLPIAVPDFAVTPADRALARSLSSVIAGDLGMGGLFAVIPPDAYLERITPKHFGRTPLSFPDWKLSGAEAVVIGNVTPPADAKDRAKGMISVEMRLYDATLGTMMARKTFTGYPRQYRVIAHKFSNEILYAFTGVRGIFDTEIAFSARPGNGKGKEIFVVGIDGQGLRKVTDNRSFNLFPRWSPRGDDTLVYTSYRTGVPMIYLREVVRNRNGLGAVYDHPVVTFGNSKSPGCLSPDGTFLYFAASIDGNSDIYRERLLWPDPEKPAPVRVAENSLEKVADGYGLEVSPTASPDGRTIAFVSDRGGAPQVYVKAIGASGDRRISFAGGYSTSPSWSPAGDRIAFTSMSGGNFSIYTVKPDGSDQRVLVSAGGADCVDPCYSPDGRYLVYTLQKKGYSELKIISADGRWERSLYSGMAGAGSPSWSPRR